MPNGVSVWSYVAPEPSTPQVGSAAPTMVRSGQTMWINGLGFGSATGTVNIGGVAATVNSWSSHEIQVTVPSGVTPGTAGVTVTTGGGTSNTYNVQMLTGAQVQGDLWISPETITASDPHPALEAAQALQYPDHPAKLFLRVGLERSSDQWRIASVDWQITPVTSNFVPPPGTKTWARSTPAPVRHCCRKSSRHLRWSMPPSRKRACR